MSIGSKFHSVTIVSLGAVILILSGIFLSGRSSESTSNQLNASQGTAPTAVDAVQEQERWSQRIREAGAEESYKEFKQLYANSNFGTQHTAAHIFGPILYETVGIRGITICDSSFSFGCYHGFFGAALSDKGLSIVTDLDKACVEKYGPYGTGCQHGIGHGLLEYMGYGNLVKALEACKLTTQKNLLHGCTSGVFMENNVPLTLGDQTARTETRKLNPNNPYEPCTDIPERFRESCYYELGQWWDKVYEKDYGTLGRLCGNIEKEAYREDCYLGVGNVVAPSTLYNIAQAIDLCEKMPDPEGKLICRAGASWSFFAEPKYRELAPSMCDGVQPYRDYSCTQKADIIRNKSIEQTI